MDELRNELARLYPTEADARRIVDSARLPAIFVDFDGSAINTWHLIVRQAAARNALGDLIEVAANEYPESTVLQRAWRSLVPSGMGARESKPVASGDKLDRVFEMVYDARRDIAVIRVWVVMLSIAVGVDILLRIF